MADQPYLDQHISPSLLHVTVRNRERVFFDSPALAVTSYNATGKFDILPEHVNFISIIKQSITIYREDKSTQEFKISTGVLKVNRNMVEIFLGILTQSAPPPTHPLTKP